MVKKVIWARPAEKQLEQAYQYIFKHSVQNAEKIKEAILSSTRKLPDNPERYPPDKYRKKNGDQTFRAYELHHFRISYKIDTEQIIIVRVRHTKMQPLEY